LWAIPTHVIVALFLSKKLLPTWVINYLMVTLVLAIGILVMWPLWPQQFHLAFIPIILTLALRAAYRIWSEKKYPHLAGVKAI
jgi:hypothetical protein